MTADPWVGRGRTPRPLALLAIAVLAGCRSSWRSPDEVACAYRLTNEFADVMRREGVAVRSYSFEIADEPSIRVEGARLTVRWPGTDGCELQQLGDQYQHVETLVADGHRRGLELTAVTCSRGVRLGFERGRLSVPMVRFVRFRHRADREAE